MKLFSKKIKALKKALFLDRDGVINKDTFGKYIISSKQLKVYTSALKALKKISQKKEYLLIIVTNQSAVGRKMMTLKKAISINRELVRKLKKEGVEISALYFCPHSPQANCECRKPKTGLIKEALKDFEIDLASSFMVGDKASDMEMAKKSGLKAILVLTGQARKNLREKEISYNFKIKDLRGLLKII